MRVRFAFDGLRRALLGSLGLTFLTFGAAANICIAADAATSQLVSRVTVKYPDLDVRQPKDAAQLYQRLRNAAREACQVTGSRDLAARSEERRCAVAALERAVRSVDRPQVTAAHERFVAKRGSKAA